MPPRRRGRPSPAQKSAVKEGISVGLVTDEEEEELGGATLEFAPLGLNVEAAAENNKGKFCVQYIMISNSLWH